MPTHRNSNKGHWKKLICEKWISIILSTGAKVGNSFEEKLGFVQSEVSFATAGNTAYSNLPRASSLIVK
ncbi:hypothetical protein ACFLTE_10210 [Bacteroidota bacterium]